MTVYVKVPGTKLQYCKGTEIENHQKNVPTPYSTLQRTLQRLPKFCFCLLHINTSVKQITKKWLE